MAVKTRATGRPKAIPANSAGRGAPVSYLIYGLRVLSDVPLPLPQDAWDRDKVADCVFALAEDRPAPPSDGPLVAGLPCNAPCHNGSLVTRVARGPGGTWFWHESVGTCHVRPDATRVDVYPELGYDERALALMLTGPVAAFVLHKLGFPSLHASGVVAGGGGVIFVGFPGHGKTTMAACFLKDGATLLTDDVLPLQRHGDEVFGLPSIPLMKIWQQTAEHTLALRTELPSLTRAYPKKLLTLDEQYLFATQPVPIRAIYVLERYDPTITGRTDILIRRLRPRDELAALLVHTSNRAFLAPGENAALLPLYSRLVAQAPVRRLVYPNGFENQAAVRSHILRDVEQP